MGLRFLLGGRKHTDIVAHSTPFFPVQTGEDFLKFFQALGASGPDAPHPTPVEQFVGSHPKTLAFVQTPKPPPVSYGTDAYFSVTAFKLIDAAGKETFIRYEIVPDAGVVPLPEAEIKTAGPNYLQEELETRLKEGPIGFKVLVQIAEEGDVTNDATVHWPESRKKVELGSFKVDKIIEDNAKEQKVCSRSLSLLPEFFFGMTRADMEVLNSISSSIRFQEYRVWRRRMIRCWR